MNRIPYGPGRPPTGAAWTIPGFEQPGPRARPIPCCMGTRGRNALVAGIAALCALVTMGIIDLSASRRAQAAAPAQGWKPLDRGAMAAPERHAVGAPAAVEAGSTGPAALERAR